jgi:cellobiose-specific phosphotransferase system component IIA
MKFSHPRLAAAAIVFVAGTAAAQVPAQNIDPARHGNLAAAQSLVLNAYDKVSNAQDANNHELGGHADRAKQLMREANDEMRLAASVADGAPAPVLPVYTAPPGVVYVAPTYAIPAPGYAWAWHAHYGWGWYHPRWGWHHGWH